jgi:serine/threonine protein kinase
MALSPGTRLGPYEILSALGAGGMGEVYRARDTKLGRDVAIKVLPSTLTSDPDRLARFQREALDTYMLAQTQSSQVALANIAANVIGGLTAVWIGYAVGVRT